MGPRSLVEIDSDKLLTATRALKNHPPGDAAFDNRNPWSRDGYNAGRTLVCHHDDLLVASNGDDQACWTFVAGLHTGRPGNGHESPRPKKPCGEHTEHCGSGVFAIGLTVPESKSTIWCRARIGAPVTAAMNILTAIPDTVVFRETTEGCRSMPPTM